MPFVRDSIERDARGTSFGARLRELNAAGKPLRLTPEMIAEIYSVEACGRRIVEQRRHDALAIGRIRHWVIM